MLLGRVIFCSMLAMVPMVPGGELAASMMGYVEKYSAHQHEKLSSHVRHRRDEDNNIPEITALSVESYVTSRYSKTVVECTLINTEDLSQEAVFELDLPETAFISNFSMLVEDVLYVGEVKEREEAQREYTEAVSRGNTAGTVTASARGYNKFRVSVNIASGDEVLFTMVYEELLVRVQGLYELTVSLRPGQLVDNITVNVYITEPQGISDVNIPEIKQSNLITSDDSDLVELDSAEVTWYDDTTVHISYSPSLEEQLDLSEEGALGEFTVRYDVIHDTGAGNIQIGGGYFVHYFSPALTEVMRKNVVFLIDHSGSMGGDKMTRTLEALHYIVGDVRSYDHFNIVLFESSITVWSTEMVSGSVTNIADARSYIATVSEAGGTNMVDGLQTSIDLLKDYELSVANEVEASSSMIILLTDGLPNDGPDNVMTQVSAAEPGDISIFTLAFGDDSDLDFLTKLALNHGGSMRKIYNDLDSVDQLMGFYSEVATPLLKDVEMFYTPDAVGNLTETHFANYFNGSELIVAGRIMGGDTEEFNVFVAGSGASDDFAHSFDVSTDDTVLPDPSRSVVDFAQRLWAYTMISDLLNKQQTTSDDDYASLLEEQALALALEYNFVTPLTSLIVVKPGDSNGTEDVARVQLKPVRGNDLADPAPYQWKAWSSGGPVSMSSGRVSSADGDPHFVVNIPGVNYSLCFTLNDYPGEIISLVSDPDTGVEVNAKIIGVDDNTYVHRVKTYFEEVGITFPYGSGKKIHIRITPTVVDIRSWEVFYIGRMFQEKMIWIGQTRFRISRRNVTITFRNNTEFEILIHKQRKNRVHVPAHLGFYITKGAGLSPQVNGLMGQFQYAKIEVGYKDKENELFVPANPKQAYLFINSRRIKVKLRKRRAGPTRQLTSCWVAMKNTHKFYQRLYRDYIVGDLYSSLMAKWGEPFEELVDEEEDDQRGRITSD